MEEDSERGKLRRTTRNEAPGDAPPGKANVADFTVSEISQALKRALEDTFGHVRVRGEIGRVSRPGSGHVYLDLKDERAVLSGVIWKGVVQSLAIKPEQGLEVIATGRISTFVGQSKYQLIIEQIEPAGLGALMALLEERRRALEAEGLFASERKRPLPFLPRVIGVVTSPTGSVIRDILHRLADRFPRHVVVWPVRVQGEKCAQEVAAAIEGFNAVKMGGALPRPDVIIVARGGGSVEDLWGFNDEIVVRAAANSAIPLISAVGHETDWTLIDYAADERAPTPTAAAERVVPVRTELVDVVDSLGGRARRALLRLADERRQRVRAAARGLPRPEDILNFARQRFDNASGRLDRSLKANTQMHRARFNETAAHLRPRALKQRIERSLEHATLLTKRAGRAVMTKVKEARRTLEVSDKLLNSLSYHSVLERGFVLVKGSDGRLIRSAEALAPGDDVGLSFHDGEVAAIIDGDTPRRERRSGSRGVTPKRSPQGELF